ncbi:sirohydrochlorin chelatase [Kushneria phosphatilytica]|uniref:Cobalamin biosynthesis protein CbiX n=1 Tax=Kushneria phosphatilytica TaxID=657387 RepID=A0A1S1NW13_9GAMM|nr:CbiX/SirB N-terminal domain-containing protein [Kushneria phosphatilytica]OHV11509.1 cobalamin biosynthesis protein CbiX [Kushneria phosphatilytica]QEL12109.1 cobalamin biosynthesis protein CbiX [Kushneria phosphatilytica]
MNKALILLAHGSTDPRWQAPFQAMEEHVRARMNMPVRLANMELCDPLLEDVVAHLASENMRHIDILPLFFAAGRHLREDVPGQLKALREAHPSVSMDLLDPVGQHPAFIEAVVHIVESRDTDSTLVQDGSHVQ